MFRKGNWYKTLEDSPYIGNVEDWLECPKCKTKPRVWIFDNGEFADCECSDTYDASPAKGISIWEYHKEHNGDISNFNHLPLMESWNNHIKQLNLTL